MLFALCNGDFNNFLGGWRQSELKGHWKKIPHLNDLLLVLHKHFEMTIRKHTPKSILPICKGFIQFRFCNLGNSTFLQQLLCKLKLNFHCSFRIKTNRALMAQEWLNYSSQEIRFRSIKEQYIKKLMQIIWYCKHL